MLLEASKFPALYPRADTCTCAMHWHVRLKSMTSWMTSPSTLSLTQFLRPDPNLWLGSNHLQKKKKKGKKKALTKLDLWLWPKSQNFQNGPVLLSFSSIFQFWDPFLHSKLRDCVNVRFLESWLLHKSWPKVKIFKKDLSCSIFRVHSC